MGSDDLPGESSATPEMRGNVLVYAGTPALFDTVRASGPGGIRVDTWYANAHLAALSRAPGMRDLRCYAAPSRASYVVIAEWNGSVSANAVPRVDAAPPASVERVERFLGAPLGNQRRRDVGEDVIDSALAYPVLFNVPAERQRAFNRWYDEEHCAMLLACPQWVMCRRFRIVAGDEVGWTHVALHYLTDLRALQSPERDSARDTPWRRVLQADPWFKPEYRVCYPLKRATVGHA